MNIGLIDVDGHNFPNLALMKLSAWHKSQGVTKCAKELGRRGIKPYRIFVYCLIQDVEESLERINALRKLKVCPFAQPYRDFDNNIEPTNEQKRLARWCNHKAIFKSVEFKNYKG